MDILAGLPFILPAAILLVGLLVYPLCDGIWLSLQHVSSLPPDRFVGLHNYVLLLQDATFWQCVHIMAEFGVAALLLEFLLGFGLALLLSRIVRGEGVIRVLILLPTMVTPTVAGMNFRMMLNFDSRGDRLPAAEHRSAGSGLGRPISSDRLPWRRSCSRTSGAARPLLCPCVERWPACLTRGIPGGCGYRRCECLAGTDSHQGTAAGAAITLALLFRIIDLFRTFDIAYILTEGDPGHLTELVSLHIYNDMFGGYFVSYSATEATIVLVLTLAVSLVVIRLINPTDER